MDNTEIINLLKKIETQVEYLRNIENLLERVVAAAEAQRKSLETLTGTITNAQAGAGTQAGTPPQQQKGVFGF